MATHKTPTKFIKDMLADKVGRQNIVLVIGAGVSIQASQHKLPDWKGMICDGLAFAGKQGYYSDAAITEIEKKIGMCKEKKSKAKSPDLLDAAGKLRELLEGKPHPSDFAQWLKLLFTPIEAGFGEPSGIDQRVLISIRNLRCPFVVTTNYDKLLTRVLGWEPITMEELSRFENWSGGMEGYIFHLHGVYDRPHTVIFGPSDYKSQLKKEKHYTELKYLWHHKTWLFIGCSSEGVEDPGFTALVNWMNEAFPNSTHEHYILVRHNEKASPEFDTRLQKLRMKKIGYGDSYSELPAWLTKIAPREPQSLPSSIYSVGRDEDMKECRKWLRDKSTRLLILTGAPGVGKTHLAQLIKRDRSTRSRFSDGIIFVNLSDLTGEDQVLPRLIEKLGPPEEVRSASGNLQSSLAVESTVLTVPAGTTEAIQVREIISYLEGKKILLILDNFEQVIGSARHIRKLLLECPNLKILVTSRDLPKVIKGEQKYTVLPLRIDYARHLFIKKAKEQDHKFMPDSEQDKQTVDDICEELSCLPLAIEIVAASEEFRTVQQILYELRNTRKWLDLHAPENDPGQQSLRTAFKWSYNRLGHERQKLFTRLSVFYGGATEEAIHKVCNATGDLGTELSSHIKSLVRSIAPCIG